MRSCCPGAWVEATLFVAFAVACHSEHSTAPTDRGETAHVPVIPAAELAKSYGLEIRPDVADGVPIRVVDAASRKPVGDALVVTVDETEFTYDDDQEGGTTWNARTLLVHSGQAYVTSGDGVARVAAPAMPRSAFVWHSGDFGRTTLEVHDRAEHVVPMAPRALIVEVVDKNGRPQSGIPVQLGACSLEPMSHGTTVGITGADGRFSIPALELERGVHRSCGRRNLVMLGCLVSGYELRPADAPRLEPVRFVLPDCGSVEVKLQDAQGRPLTRESASATGLFLSVNAVDTAKRREARGLERRESESDEDERSIALPVEGDSYRFEHVEVGTRLFFTLDVEDGPSTSFDGFRPIDAATDGPHEVIGPSKAGEIRRAVLRALSFGAKEEEEAAAAAVSTRETERADSSKALDSESGSKPASPSDDGSIAIGVKLDVPIDACWLRARLDENHEPYDHDTCPWIDVNGHATMRQIPAGTHSVTITESRFSDHDADVPLCRIDDIRVGPSQHLRDPRLLNIDLRGKLRTHHLEVVDGDGHPLSGWIHLEREGDPGFDDRRRFEKGRVDFLTAVDDGVRATVEVSRFRPLDLDVNSSDRRSADGRVVPRRIVMKHGIPIRLALAPGFELPRGPHDPIYIGVSEAPRCDKSRDELRTIELRPDADLHFDVTEPGDWAVVFLRSHDDGGDAPSVTERHSVETTISVPDGSREQVITVAPDRDCWDALMKSIAR